MRWLSKAGGPDYGLLRPARYHRWCSAAMFAVICVDAASIEDIESNQQYRCDNLLRSPPPAHAQRFFLAFTALGLAAWGRLGGSLVLDSSTALPMGTLMAPGRPPADAVALQT